jgi:hypothetical protein
MRQALVVSVLILIALGSALVLFPRDTGRFFSWPIEPALTASVLAANYYTATAILLLTMRGWVWAPVKVVLPGGIVFSAVMVVATLIHLDRFNFGGDATSGSVIAWIWLIAYLILPPLLLALWPSQARADGTDPPIDRAPAWLGPTVVGIGALMALAGAVLFLAPARAAEVWPWQLTGLTARVLSGWALGLGLVFAVAGRTGDRMRMRAPVAGLVAFAALQGLALARHGADATGAAFGVWVGFLALCLVVGAAGLPSVWASDPARIGTPA